MYNHKLIEMITRERERNLALERYRRALAAGMVDGGRTEEAGETRGGAGLIRRSMRQAAALLGITGFRTSMR